MRRVDSGEGESEGVQEDVDQSHFEGAVASTALDVCATAAKSSAMELIVNGLGGIYVPMYDEIHDGSESQCCTPMSVSTAEQVELCKLVVYRAVKDLLPR